MSEGEQNSVERVLSCRNEDYYGILQINKTTSQEEMKKVYKNLIRKVHPDKNSHSGANEAFQRVLQAYENLILKKTRNVEQEDISCDNKSFEENNFQHESSYAASYSSEDLNIIRRILSCGFNDYYAILNIQRNATKEEVERSYKILHQRVPPEKNSAPGAARAFSRVFKAYKSLRAKFEADEKTKKNDYQKPLFSQNNNQNSYFSNPTKYSTSAPRCSSEDRDLIKRILRCDPNDVFHILNIHKNASANEIKEAFSILKQKLNLDTNFVPGVGRALRIVNKASELYDQQRNHNLNVENNSDFTQSSFEDLKVVERILRCNSHDFYSLLDINKNAPTEEISKAFDVLLRRVRQSLKFVPGAGRAFDTVKEAREIFYRTLPIDDNIHLIIERILKCDPDDYCSVLKIGENATTKDVKNFLEILRQKLTPVINKIQGAARALIIVNQVYKMYCQQYEIAMQVISRILDCHYEDYYCILGINENATEERVQESFDSLQQIINPKKCFAPSAGRAFSWITKAYNMLMKRFMLNQKLNSTKRHNQERTPSAKNNYDYQKYSYSWDPQNNCSFAPPYSPEDLVERILRYHPDDYNIILNVKQNADAKDVKRSFEILAEKLHTKRNVDPGAAEAYIRVKRAYQKLMNRFDSDKTSRSKQEKRFSSTPENNYYQHSNTLNPQSDSSFNPHFSTEDSNIIREKDDTLEKTKTGNQEKTLTSQNPHGCNQQNSNTSECQNDSSTTLRNSSYDVDIVSTILGCNPDNYSFLNLDEFITVDDVKESYKTFIRLIHLDKNVAPGAAEVYMLVNRAYKSLMEKFEFNEKSNNMNVKIKKTPSSSQNNIHIQEYVDTLKFENDSKQKNSDFGQRDINISNSQIDSTSTFGGSTDNLSEVQRILSFDSEDYYGILNINKNATAHDIIKSFQLLGKQVHPEKNEEPSANKAFEMVDKAYKMLVKHYCSNEKILKKNKEKQERVVDFQSCNYSSNFQIYVSSTSQYSINDLTIVKGILRCDPNDYYRLLNVNQNATVEDVIQSFGRLILLVDPDENLAPDADKAFKIVYRAFKMLMKGYRFNEILRETKET